MHSRGDREPCHLYPGHFFYILNILVRTLPVFSTAMVDSRILRALILWTILFAGTPGAADAGAGTLPAASPLAIPHPRQDADPAPAGDAGSPWWKRIYAAGFYDTRWDGWFLQSFGQLGRYINDEQSLSLYGIGMLTTDTRSTGGGTLPVIISDNVFILGVGVRYKPVSWVWFDAQEGVAFDLIERAGESTVNHDFRLIATGGSGIYPDFRVHDDLQVPLSLMADCFASAGYYSRYDNVIAYLQGRVGVRAVEVSTAFADVYLRGDMALDGNGEYYNNIFEIGPGVRFTPNPDWGLFLMIEYRSGRYADYSDEMRMERELYYPPSYEAWRFFLVFDRTF